MRQTLTFARSGAVAVLFLLLHHTYAQNWETLFAQGQQALAAKDYKAAALALERALPNAEQEFKTQHPNYIKTLYTLAEAYKGLNEPKKERSCYLTLLNVKKDLRQERTKEFAQLQYLAAVTYVQSKEYTNAENYFNQSLALQKALKQDQTTDFVVTQHEYARLLRLTNRLDKAEAQYLPAYEQGIKLLGNKNPRMAEMAAEIADLQFRLKKYEKANQFYLKWIELCKVQQIPAEQYYKAYWQLHLGYKLLQKPQETVQYGEEYLKAVQTYDATNLVDEISKVAKNYAELQQYPAVVAAIQKKVDAIKAAHTEQSMTYAVALAELAAAEIQIGKAEQAEQHLQKTIEISRAHKKTPEQEIIHISYMAQLASLYKQTGKRDKAEVALINVAEQAQKLNDKQLQYGRAIDSLAFYYWAVSDLSKADSLLKISMEIRKKNLTDRHPEYAAALSNYADFLLAQNKPEAAEALLKQANLINANYHGRGSLEYTLSTLKLADVAALRKNYPEAIRLYRSILENQRRLQGEQSLAYQETLKKIADITAEMNKK